jgi:hypothetical protein
MKILAIILLSASVSIGCGKKDAAPEQPTNDSLLSKPLDPERDPVIVPGQDSFKQYIDPRRVRTPEHLAIMKRFKATEVAKIYHRFRPLRQKQVTPQSPEVTTFLSENGISLDELKAILEEGDRLGWSKVQL